MSEYIVGIDVGTSKVCAAMSKVDKHGRFQVVGTAAAACSGLKRLEIVDTEAVAEAVKACKYQLEAIANSAISEVYVSIPGGLCELVSNRGVAAVEPGSRGISHRDVERVLNSAKTMTVPPQKQIIGVIPVKFAVDGFDSIKDPVGMTGSRLEVEAKVALIPSAFIYSLLKILELSNLSIKGIVLQPLAQASLFLRREEEVQCFAVVDVGADMVDISIYESGSIRYTNTVPLGGSSITSDVSQCLKLSFDEAERLKVMHGSINNSDVSEETIKFLSASDENINISRALLTDVIRARVEELIYFIKDALNTSGFYRELRGITVAGGGISAYKGIEELCEGLLGKPVRTLPHDYSGGINPLYTTCIGIVKYVFDEMEKASDVEKEQPSSSIAGEVKGNAARSSFVSKIKGLIEEFF